MVRSSTRSRPAASRAAETRTREYRERLLGAMVDAITDTGYAELSVADIVQRARVSKRTFYEHFATKEDCLLAVYEEQGAQLVAEIERAIRTVPRGEARLATGVAVYLTALQSRAGLVRTLLVEILHVGPRGLAMRRRVMRQFADLLRREMQAAGATGPLTGAVATALVGGINELVLDAVAEDRTDRLSELAGAVAALMRPFFRPTH